jgi:thymidylate synthase ThyX
MKIENFVYPKNADKDEWQKYYEGVFTKYELLCEKLKVKFEECLPKFKKKDAVKKAQEFARYVLPQGMGAYLYHTINLTVALRYIALAKELPEVRDEATQFADLLAKELLEIDSSLTPLIEYAKSAKAKFSDFDMDGFKKSQNIKDSESVRVYDVINPFSLEVDANYGDVLRVSMMSVDAASLGGFSSYIKMSFSADAQNQRHRRSVGVRPGIEKTFKKEYYLPPIIEQDDELKAIYDEAMTDAYSFFEKEAKKVGFGEAVYALPNSHMIEILERNDIASFNHKSQRRLCYNAQQELYDIVSEQVKELRRLGINGSDKLLPHCSLRSQFGIHPVCPEGHRFWGVKVWKQDFDEMKREY